jgi:hypothetical protein
MLSKSMTESNFWKLINDVQGEGPHETADQLTKALAEMPIQSILDFGHHWDNLHDRAYSWPLWGAAYLIQGGCSDDGFIDFRSWLILQGEKVYSDALGDPDSLANVKFDPDQADCECYPGPEAYDAKIEKAKVQLDYYTALEMAYPGRVAPQAPSGEEWDFDDMAEMKKRFPLLCNKFG